MKTEDSALENFTIYSKWYDAFNSNKNYSEELNYVFQKVVQVYPSPQSWLDVGCGTGKHLASLLSRGLHVVGVDKSVQMLEIARKANPSIDFVTSDATSYRLDKKFDVASMLFHVMSYLSCDMELVSSLKNISRHLKENGIFAFDFWHTTGLRLDSPQSRVRSESIGNRRLFRISIPRETVHPNKVDIRFEFRWDTSDGPLAHQESHVMRHFSANELQHLLSDSGFQVLQCESWMKGRELEDEDWYGLIIAQKNRCQP